MKKIVDNRKNTTKQTIAKQYFTEISNHIDHIMVDVLASEIDVKESVEGLIDEEYREEKQIELKLTHDLEKLRELLKEIDTAKGKKISELEVKIAELRSNIGEQVTSLPFAYFPNVAISGSTIADQTFIAGDPRFSNFMGMSDQNDKIVIVGTPDLKEVNKDKK